MWRLCAMCHPSLASDRPVGVTRWLSDSSVSPSSTSFVDFVSSFQSFRKALTRRYMVRRHVELGYRIYTEGRMRQSAPRGHEARVPSSRRAIMSPDNLAL